MSFNFISASLEVFCDGIRVMFSICLIRSACLNASGFLVNVSSNFCRSEIANKNFTNEVFTTVETEKTTNFEFHKRSDLVNFGKDLITWCWVVIEHFKLTRKTLSFLKRKKQIFVNYEDIKTTKEQIKLIHDTKQVVLTLMLIEHQTLAKYNKNVSPEWKACSCRTRRPSTRSSFRTRAPCSEQDSDTQARSPKRIQK
jgi:hypothetical protein